MHDELQVTPVFIIHDQEEALKVVCRVVVLNGGRIEQVGDPGRSVEQPATPFVCQFIGDDVNWFRGRLHDGRDHIGNTAIELNASEHGNTERAVFYVLPHEIEILPHREVSDLPGRQAEGIRRHYAPDRPLRQ